MAIRKFLDLSTVHLSLATIERFEAWTVPLTTYPHPEGFGWFVYVPADLDLIDVAGMELPADLLACIKSAHAQDCDYLLFDRDADPIEDLPLYDEEPDDFAKEIKDVP